jgi:hypothetical protein
MVWKAQLLQFLNIEWCSKRIGISPISSAKAVGQVPSDAADMIGIGWAGAIIGEEQAPKEPLATGVPLRVTLAA